MSKTRAMKNVTVTLNATMSSYLTWTGTVQIPADLTPEEEEVVIDFLHQEVDGGSFEEEGDGWDSDWHKDGGDIAPADPGRQPEYRLERQGDDEWELLDYTERAVDEK